MNFVTEPLQKILDRDITRLEEEIKLFPSEDLLWQTAGEVKNSAGNLCLHLCGNLQFYIGAILGDIEYVRNRDNEFAAKNIPRKDLLIETAKAKRAVKLTLEKLNTFALEQEYPLQVFGAPMTTSFFLIHLTAHLSYHLGQVNYLRRLIASQT